MDRTARTQASWHFWLIAALLLLWNAFGGYDYYMTQIGSRAYLAPMSEPYGLSVDTVIAYYQSFPLWMEAAWGLAIWTSFAGAVLMMMRSAFAYHAFVVSCVAMVAALGWQLTHPMPGVSDLVAGYIMTGIVFAVIVFEIWYCRTMAKRGVLR